MRYRIFLLVYFGSMLFALIASNFAVPSADTIERFEVEVRQSAQAGSGNVTLTKAGENQDTLFIPRHGGTLSIIANSKPLAIDPENKSARINRYQSAALADLPPVRPLELYLKLSLDQINVGLGSLYIGPSAPIRAYARQRIDFMEQVHATIPIALGLSVIGALFLIFFSQTPLRYFFFLLCLMCNVFIEFEPRIQIFGFPFRPFISYFGTFYTLVIFITGNLWLSSPKSERHAALFCALAIITVLALLDLALGLDSPRTDFTRVLLFALPAATVAIISGVRAVRSLRDGDVIIQAAVACIAIILTAFCLNLVRMYVVPDNDAIYHMFFVTKIAAAIGIVGLAGSALAYEFGVYRAARQQIAVLSNITAGHHLALDQQSRTLKAEIEQRAILEERQRFTRDMHDGIGGQLLSMLLKARSGTLDPKAMEAELSDSINDLRLVTASLDAAEGNLDDALSGFEMRIADQLKAANMILEWRSPKDITALKLAPRATLEMLRIMQEAVTNAIRHSGASVVAVDIDFSENRSGLSVSITDNGCGLCDASERRTGKGMGNMETRAARLAGALSITPGVDGQGTSIMLTIPGTAEPLT